MKYDTRQLIKTTMQYPANIFRNGKRFFFSKIIVNRLCINQGIPTNKIAATVETNIP